MGLLLLLLTPWNRILVEKQTVELVKIYRILWNPKVHYRVHKTPSPPRGIHSERSHAISLRFLIIASCLRLGLPSGLLPSGFHFHCDRGTARLRLRMEEMASRYGG
jgi:hypothetical protein